MKCSLRPFSSREVLEITSGKNFTRNPLIIGTISSLSQNSILKWDLYLLLQLPIAIRSTCRPRESCRSRRKLPGWWRRLVQLDFLTFAICEKTIKWFFHVLEKLDQFLKVIKNRCTLYTTKQPNCQNSKLFQRKMPTKIWSGSSITS